MTDRTLDPEVTRYLAVVARLAPRTIEAYRRDLIVFGNWLAKPMAEVQREDVERYLADLRAEGPRIHDDRAPGGGAALLSAAPGPDRCAPG